MQLFDFIFFLFGKFHLWPGQQVKDGKFLLGELFGDGAMFFRAEFLRKG